MPPLIAPVTSTLVAKVDENSESENEEDQCDSEDEEEEDICKVITYEGKRYLQSKKSQIIYDYAQYKSDESHVKLGKWNENKKCIDFEEENESSDEEDEDEYDE